VAASIAAKDWPDVYHPKIYDMIVAFREEALTVGSDYSYTGQDCEENSAWVFESSFLFAMTIVTTIGYGHVTPKSWEGYIICICYATIGIYCYYSCLMMIKF
jgi:hypothetical protein